MMPCLSSHYPLTLLSKAHRSTTIRGLGYRTVCIFYSLVLFACANQTTPQGGPKDKEPPVLVSSIPKNKSTNYKAKYLQLEFNENIGLNQPSKEVLIIPSIGKDIKYTIKKRRIFVIEPKKSWADSTTYSISIREGVRDLTEKNPPKNIKISFSSGPYIDSLSIFGKVNFVLRESFPSGKKIVVALYASDTFDIFNHTPYYFTEVDDEGKFNMGNLKEDKYYIYAFADKNKNMKVESTVESYGFLANPFSVVNTSDSLTIPMISLDSKKLKINTIRNNGLYTVLTFNKSIIQYKLQHTYDSNIAHSFGDYSSEIKIYNPKNIKDSVQFSLQANDSLDIAIDTTFFIKEVQKGTNFIPDDFILTTEKIKIKMKENHYDMHLKIKLSKPLKLLNYDSVFIPLDSIKVVSFEKENIIYDSIHKELSLSKNLFKYVEEDSLFQKNRPLLSFGKGFIISIENDSSKAQTHKIPFIEKNKTGTLLIEVQSQEPHYEIQLFSAKGELIESIHDKKTYSFKNIPVQDYKIRVIIDRNNNGKWDIGSIYKREEPESVFFYKTLEGKYTFPIRANWELGPLLLVF